MSVPWGGAGPPAGGGQPSGTLAVAAAASDIVIVTVMACMGVGCGRGQEAAAVLPTPPPPASAWGWTRSGVPSSPFYRQGLRPSRGDIQLEPRAPEAFGRKLCVLTRLRGHIPGALLPPQSAEEPLSTVFPGALLPWELGCPARASAPPSIRCGQLLAPPKGLGGPLASQPEWETPSPHTVHGHWAGALGTAACL